jgi:hypothetical protein
MRTTVTLRGRPTQSNCVIARRHRTRPRRNVELDEGTRRASVQSAGPSPVTTSARSTTYGVSTSAPFAPSKCRWPRRSWHQSPTGLHQLDHPVRLAAQAASRLHHNLFLRARARVSGYPTRTHARRDGDRRYAHRGAHLARNWATRGPTAWIGSASLCRTTRCCERSYASSSSLSRVRRPTPLVRLGTKLCPCRIAMQPGPCRSVSSATHAPSRSSVPVSIVHAACGTSRIAARTQAAEDRGA